MSRDGLVQTNGQSLFVKKPRWRGLCDVVDLECDRGLRRSSEPWYATVVGEPIRSASHIDLILIACATRVSRVRGSRVKIVVFVCAVAIMYKGVFVYQVRSRGVYSRTQTHNRQNHRNTTPFYIPPSRILRQKKKKVLLVLSFGLGGAACPKRRYFSTTESLPPNLRGRDSRLDIWVRCSPAHE